MIRTLATLITIAFALASCTDAEPPPPTALTLAEFTVVGKYGCSGGCLLGVMFQGEERQVVFRFDRVAECYETARIGEVLARDCR